MVGTLVFVYFESICSLFEKLELNHVRFYSERVWNKDNNWKEGSVKTWQVRVFIPIRAPHASTKLHQPKKA